MGTTSGLRDRLRQPGTFVAQRIPCRRESDTEDQIARRGYPFPTPNESYWPKSERVLAAKPSGRSRVLPPPTLFWPGIGDWSPRSLTAPNTGSIQAALLFHQKS